MYRQYSYEEVLSASERFSWRFEDLIGGDKQLDFARPFLPEALTRTQSMTWMTSEQRRIANQISGAFYLHMFGLVEEFILPFVLDHVRPRLDRDDCRVRAFLGFAAEEAKHIQLFRKFREEFDRSFGSACAMIGPPDAIGRKVLSYHPLAVALVILHIEWMTQRHFLDSVQDDRTLDPQFKSLLRHHWMEEIRHAKLDTRMAEAIAAECSDQERAAAVQAYLDIGMFLDGGLAKQAGFDAENFVKATGRALSADERDMFIATTHQALRWTFIGSGMTHANFLATIDRIRPGAAEILERIAPTFC